MLTTKIILTIKRKQKNGRISRRKYLMCAYSTAADQKLKNTKFKNSLVLLELEQSQAVVVCHRIGTEYHPSTHRSHDYSVSNMAPQILKV